MTWSLVELMCLLALLGGLVLLYIEAYQARQHRITQSSSDDSDRDA